MHNVDAKAFAWHFRNVYWSAVIGGVGPDPENKDRITNWARSYREALHPHAAGASCVNFMMAEGKERIKETYGGNYARLQSVKSNIDPGNFLHVNPNIEPQ